MRTLRSVYIGLTMVIGLPVILAWFVIGTGWSIYVAIRERENPVKMVAELFSEPIKFAIFVYGNWIKYGNKYGYSTKKGPTL